VQVKSTAWEGSTRTVALLWSKDLEKKKRVSNQLMHISDWLPTLYSAAGNIFTFEVLIDPWPV
jgi:arylsulfatase A-like enzyme